MLFGHIIYVLLFCDFIIALSIYTCTFLLHKKINLFLKKTKAAKKTPRRQAANIKSLFSQRACPMWRVLLWCRAKTNATR